MSDMDYSSTDEMSDRITELLLKGEPITDEEREEMTDLAQTVLVVALVRSTGIDVDKAIDIIDRAGTMKLSYVNGSLEITQTADDHGPDGVAVTIEESTHG